MDFLNSSKLISTIQAFRMAPNTNVQEMKSKLEEAIREIDTEAVYDLAEELNDMKVDLKEFYNMADMLNRTKQRRGYYEKVKQILNMYV